MTGPEYKFGVVPPKKLEIKTAIELLQFSPENGLNLDGTLALISQEKYDQLPDSLAFKEDIPELFTLEVVFRKIGDRDYHVLRHLSSPFGFSSPEGCSSW